MTNSENFITVKLHNFVIFLAYCIYYGLGNAGKDYNSERTTYLGISLWDSLTKVKVSLMDFIHLFS